MPTVVCYVEQEIKIGAISKEMVADGNGNRYFIGEDSTVTPYGTLKKGTKCQLRHGIEAKGEQLVYIACKEGSGWFTTKNTDDVTLNSCFKAVRKNRSPWEALH